MSATRRIMICLPESLVEEMDCIMTDGKPNRSELMREALRFYLAEKRKSNLREQLRHGYVEMAQINLTIAQEACYCEEEANVVIKKMLVECC